MSDLGLSRVELTPDDRDPQATFDAMLASVQAALPTWDARNGALETVLMEAWATGTADLIYALNRLPGRIEEDILALYDVARYAGARATGTAVITWDTSRTATVSAGLRFAVPDSDIELEVTTTTTGTGSTLSVPVRATEPGSAPNSVTSGAALDVRAGREALACARQHDHAHLVEIAEAIEDQHRLFVKGPCLRVDWGIVHRHDRDVLVELDAELGQVGKRLHVRSGFR